MKITKELATEMLKSGNEVLVNAAKEAYQELGKSNFEIACEKLGIEPIIPDGLSRSMQALFQLGKIIEVANEGWYPDFDNHNQCKHAPWFKKERGCQVFYCVVNWSTASSVPAPSLLKNSELAEYAGTQFLDIYTKAFAL